MLWGLYLAFWALDMLSVTVLTSTTDVAYYYILLMFCVCRVLLKMSPRAYFNLQAQKSKHCWCQKYHVGKTSLSRTIVIDILFLGELESEIPLTKKGKVMFLVFSCPYVETCSTHSSVKEHLHLKCIFYPKLWPWTSQEKLVHMCLMVCS